MDQNTPCTMICEENSEEESTNEIKDQETENRLLIFDRNGSGCVHWIKVNDDCDGLANSIINRELHEELVDVTDFSVVTVSNKLYIIGGKHLKSGECSNQIFE